MDENYEKRGYLLEDFRLFHLKDDRGTKVDYHYHEFCKIVLLLSGSGSYTVEGRRYLLLPGDIVLVGSRCVHKPEFEEGISYERMILYISPSLLAENSVPDYSLEDVFSGKPGHVLRPAEDVRRRLRSLADRERNGRERRRECDPFAVYAAAPSRGNRACNAENRLRTPAAGRT